MWTAGVSEVGSAVGGTRVPVGAKTVAVADVMVSPQIGPGKNPLSYSHRQFAEGYTPDAKTVAVAGRKN